MRLFGGGGNGLMHQFIIDRIAGAIHLVFVQLPQLKNGPANLCWAGTLVNQRLINHLADLGRIKLLFHL